MIIVVSVKANLRTNNIKNSTLEIIQGEKHGSYIIHSDKIYKIIKKYLED